MGCGSKKVERFFFRGVENKTKKSPFPSPTFLSILSLSIPISLNLSSPGPFVIPTTNLRTLDPFNSNVYMRERNRF